VRVPLEWLHEYCAPHLSAGALAERLAMTGTEVERVEHHGVGALEHFVVGKVLERHKHPDADRLSVCMVEVGGSTPVQIVCGADNVAAGQTVAVARPGAIMPDGKELRKEKLRGQLSDGMILAEDEVGIGTDHWGIMVLDDGIEPGAPLEQVLPIATEVLVLEITPNRPDCLGIYGVAREVAAVTGAQLKPPPWEHDLGSDGPLEGIEIINAAGAELCPRFTARLFEQIKLGPSPWWLKARLMAAGQRPISNVVDVTNYVMLLTGQPMHAFDYEKVVGRRLTVRQARPREQVQTLDDQTRILDEQMVVIEDGEGPTSIAGVMGGARSEVSEETTAVLSEVATWNGPNIHRTGLQLGLRSEALSRFEKQLQPEQTLWAQAVATKLFIDVCGASVRPGTIDLGGPGPEAKVLPLRTARVASLLGVEVGSERAAAILTALGFSSSRTPDGLNVRVPDFRRGDVTREVDLIEEVARIEVLENLPATLPARHNAVGGLTPVQRQRRRALDALAAQGLHEVVGWSFTGPDLHERLRVDGRPALTLANPMSSEQSQLRTTLIGSLLDIAQHNRAQGAAQLRLFEAGAVYEPGGGGELPREPQHLAAILSGPVRRATWREPAPPPADFFTAKGALGAVLESLGASWRVRYATTPFLHPGRSAEILVEDEPAGWLGELHPSVVAGWELTETVAGFELDLDAVPIAPAAIYEDLTSFPEVREDLAVVVAENISAAEVLETVRTAGSPLLAEAEVFDGYTDAERLGAGNVSLAIRLAYRAADRTLTDTEVARHRQLIATALERELGGRVRDH
jgi:phenylalanyl-tRNA synthetase beta chain